jgi:hypothetical protein
MKKRILICSFLSVITATFSQNTIALWNYNTITGSPANPIADVGTGTSSAVGSMVVGRKMERIQEHGRSRQIQELQMKVVVYNTMRQLLVVKTFLLRGISAGQIQQQIQFE